MYINFNKNPKLLTESWLNNFGEWNKFLLDYIYGKDTKDVYMIKEEEQVLKFNVKGTVKQLRSYADALFSEKDYLEAYAQFGKDHPMTNQRRVILQQAVGQFEQTTGITWPFSDED
jgi:hypothetical protein